MKLKFNYKKILLPVVLILAVLIFGYLLYTNGIIKADISSEIKTSNSMNKARFAIDNITNWNTGRVTFKVTAGMYKSYTQCLGCPTYPEQYPKVTGRFFCNKPVPASGFSGNDYYQLYQTPDAKFETGSYWPPTDIDISNGQPWGMKYSWIPGENYEANVQRFMTMDISNEYSHTCNYSQPGEYWPLFFAEGLGAWYSQKIIINSVVTPSITPTRTASRSAMPSPSPSPTRYPSPSPSPSPSAIPQDLYKAGYSVIGYRNVVRTDVFGKNGFAIYSYNSALKRWDKTVSTAEYVFQPNKAYYIKTAVDKYVNRISPSAIDYNSTIQNGWNFIWTDQANYLHTIYLTILNTQGQCIAKNVPLNVLKNEDMVYQWIFNVADGSATETCKAFALLTGRNLPSTTCTSTNIKLSEVANTKAKSGLWVYLWPDKVNSWSQKGSYPCN